MGTLGIMTMRGLIQEGGLGAWAPASLMLPSEARASRRRLQMAFLRPERWLVSAVASSQVLQGGT